MRCSGVSPLLMCLQSCLALRFLVYIPFVCVVDRLAKEVFVPIYFHGVQWCVGGVLWVRDVVGWGESWSFWGFRCVEGSAR